MIKPAVLAFTLGRRAYRDT